MIGNPECGLGTLGWDPGLEVIAWSQGWWASRESVGTTSAQGLGNLPDDLRTMQRFSFSLVPMGLWASGRNGEACLAGLGLPLW